MKKKKKIIVEYETECLVNNKQKVHYHDNTNFYEKFNSMIGSSELMVIDNCICIVDIVKNYVSFLADESCGKCVTCREGIGMIHHILESITKGQGIEKDIDLLLDLCETVQECSLCGLGKTAPNPVMTTIKYFRDEYMEHIINRRCPAGVCKELTSFYIDPKLCKGCGLCKKRCSTDSIKGEIESPHKIDMSKCIKCGSCVDICKFAAVRIGGKTNENYNKW